MKLVLPLLAGIFVFQVVTRIPGDSSYAAAQSEEQAPRRFENLSPENKKLVKQNYQKLLLAQEKKDFPRMCTMAEEILAIVDDYNDTRAYLLIAKRGIELARLDKEVDSQTRKELALRNVAILELKGEGLVLKAKSDVDSRVELYKTMKELEGIDPSNEYPSTWKARLRQGP